MDLSVIIGCFGSVILIMVIDELRSWWKRRAHTPYIPLNFLSPQWRRCSQCGVYERTDERLCSRHAEPGRFEMIDMQQQSMVLAVQISDYCHLLYPTCQQLDDFIRYALWLYEVTQRTWNVDSIVELRAREWTIEDIEDFIAWLTDYEEHMHTTINVDGALMIYLDLQDRLAPNVEEEEEDEHTETRPTEL